MNLYHGTHVAMIGVGFLLEYIFPCVKNLVGEENVAACVMGTSADPLAIEGKQQRMGIRILYKDNERMLAENQPDIIIFGPQPVFAAEIAQTVLKPYYDALRAQGKALPDLYVAPPSPVGKFYRDLLGADVHVMNMLPNMLTQIAGHDVAKQGVNAVTYAEGDEWPLEKKRRLAAFFDPYGRTVEVPPHQVMTYLGGQCALQAVTEYVHTIHEACRKGALEVGHRQIASAMRAAFRRRYDYHFPTEVPCAEQDVPEPLRQPLESVVVALFEGVTDACLKLGMTRDSIDDLMLSWLDLHLCTLQTEDRAQTVQTTANHATKGGVAEMGLRVYYAKTDYLLTTAFRQPEHAAEDLTQDLCQKIREAAAYCTEVVMEHGSKLGEAGKQPVHIEQHAMMYALLVRAAFAYLGDDADKAVHTATVLYGSQRGERMRARALEHGFPLDMAAYFALQEWRARPDEFDGITLQKTPCLVTCQRLCPWTQAWKLFSMEQYGKLYCRDVDAAILHGFDPQLTLQLDQTLSGGDPCCHFTFDNACEDEAFAARRDRYAQLLGDSAVRPFAYHTAHVFCAFRGVMESYGQRGQRVMEQAEADFKDYFKENQWQQVAAYFDEFKEAAR